VRRAHEVLRDAERILETVAQKGLFVALAEGVFADTRRPRDRGRGFDGVVRRDAAYVNPFTEAWSETPAGARA
jgi:beta-lysine 5,6-aminomutase alpha subunit